MKLHVMKNWKVAKGQQLPKRKSHSASKSRIVEGEIVEEKKW